MVNREFVQSCQRFLLPLVSSFLTSFPGFLNFPAPLYSLPPPHRFLWLWWESKIMYICWLDIVLKYLSFKKKYGSLHYQFTSRSKLNTLFLNKNPRFHDQKVKRVTLHRHLLLGTVLCFQNVPNTSFLGFWECLWFLVSYRNDI